MIRDVLWRYDGTGVLDQHDAVWTVPSDGGTPVRRTSPEHGASGVSWSPDGTRIAFVGDRRPERTIADHPQVWSIPAGGGNPSRVSPEGHVVIESVWGRHGIVWRGWQARVPAWQTIGAWVRRGREVVQLAAGRDLFLAPAGYSELTADADGPCLAWLDDNHVVAIASERGISLPWRLGLDGSAECLAPGVSAGCVMLRVADGRVFVIASVDGDVGEVHEVEEGRLRRIPRGTGRWFAPYRQEAERVTVKRRTLPDVDGWLVRAKTGRGARPLIVRPHGGPFDAFGPVSRFEDLAPAARGYHVLRPNPRGSISYGEGFARALDGVWGDPDSEDIFALIDRLVRDGLVDRSRMGVMGLSYGGFMVHWLLANFPGRFKAGVSENPFTTVMADYGAGDSAEDIEEGMGLPPWPDVANWHARSPVFRIHGRQFGAAAAARVRGRSAAPSDPLRDRVHGAAYGGRHGRDGAIPGGVPRDVRERPARPAHRPARAGDPRLVRKVSLTREERYGT